VVVEYSDDLLGRTTATVVDPGAGKLNLTTVNGYNPQGQLVAVTDARGNTTEFTFDTAGRMTRLEDALNERVQLSYDAAGQLLFRARAKGAHSRPGG
jgi:YD repeat-containing protein